LLVVLGCAHRGGTAAETGESEVPPLEHADQVDAPSLAEIADAIDPGPRAALTVELPAWLVLGLGLPTTPSDPQQAWVQAQAEFDTWDARSKSGDGSIDAEGLIALARALALAERAAGTLDDAPVELLLVLERIYRVIDIPALSTDRNLFARLIQGFVEVIATEGDVQGSAVIDELAGLTLDGLKRAGDLHRRTVAVLLRRVPGHAEIPDIVARTAIHVFDRDEALAVGMVRRSIAMRREAATAAHWLDLAALCHRALELRCGEEALIEAEALAPSAGDDKVKERLEEGRALAKAARSAVDLEDAPGLSDSLLRAAALVELQRYDEAKEIFGHLHELHPRDARPVVGLANAVIADDFDIVTAFEILERARPLEHLDREWYELAIGVRSTALMYYILPQVAGQDPDAVFEALRPMLMELRHDIDGLDALGTDEGRVLSFLYDLGMEMWPHVRSDDEGAMLTLARAMLVRAQALRAEVPTSLHAYTLVLASAEFSDDREQALAVLDLEPPSEHREALVVRRAQAAFALVAAWEASDHVDTMLRLVDAADGPERPLAVRRLVVDAHVLAYRLGHRGDTLDELERRYRELRGTFDNVRADAVLLNNLAAVVADQARFEEAYALWAEAIALSEEDERGVPRINGLAARIARVDDEAVLGELAEMAESGKSVELRLLAHAWTVAGSKGERARKARKALQAAAEHEAATNLRPRNLPGKSGVILRGSFQVNLGYSSTQGMQLELDMVAVPWLTVPCPVAIPDPRHE